MLLTWEPQGRGKIKVVGPTSSVTIYACCNVEALFPSSKGHDNIATRNGLRKDALNKGNIFIAVDILALQ